VQLPAALWFGVTESAFISVHQRYGFTRLVLDTALDQMHTSRLYTPGIEIIAGRTARHVPLPAIKKFTRNGGLYGATQASPIRLDFRPGGVPLL